MKVNYLFPRKYKKIGWLLLIPSTILNLSKMKINAFKIVSLLLFFNVLIVTAQSHQNEKELLNKIDNYLKNGEQNGISGAVLVAKAGKIIYNKGFGMADRELIRAYTPNTISTVGSVTKQFTAAAILKLVELKKLKLTDAISKYFSNLPEDKKDITIHQLLTHSAGFEWNLGNLTDFDHIPTDSYFKQLFDTELANQPGTKFGYSNSGYSILARIIELVTDETYENFLNTNLFRPSGMLQTGYFIPKWDTKLYAKGYESNVINTGSLAARFHKEGKIAWRLKGNGGLHSTHQDMFKWYLALRNNTVLSKASIKLLTTPYIVKKEGESTHYAYGWSIYTSDRNTKIIAHNGSNNVFFHEFIWLPEEDVVIIYSTNGYFPDIFGLAWQIEKMVFDDSFIPEPIEKNMSNAVLKYVLNHKGSTDNLYDDIKQKFMSKVKEVRTINRLGFRFLKEKKYNEAIVLFKLNAEHFPNERYIGNLWENLGEAYFLNNQKELAKTNFEKAIALKDDENCYWCENATNRLKELNNKK